ncbi:MAG: hypothetical protein IE880_04955 [Epsilonproteobacteria bacterium]|nr:hypothetical protein [Campylobacterota bacterium]
MDDAEAVTKYSSIMIAKKTPYDIDRLNSDIQNLLASKNKIEILKSIVPEFNHKINDKEN